MVTAVTQGISDEIITPFSDGGSRYEAPNSNGDPRIVGRGAERANAQAATVQAVAVDIEVTTGDRANAGTDDRISMKLSGRTGPTGTIASLKAFSQDPGRDLFERGNTDRFKVTLPRLIDPICKILVTSSGTGNKPNWYLEKVVVRGPGGVTTVKIEQWLSVTEPPRQLTAIRNWCREPPGSRVTSRMMTWR